MHDPKTAASTPKNEHETPAARPPAPAAKPPAPAAKPPAPAATRWYDRVPLHPVLFAAFPVLALYAVNYHETGFWDAFRAVFHSVAIVTLLTLILTTFFPSRSRAAMLASLVAVIFFTYGPLYGLNVHLAQWGVPVLLRDRILLPMMNIGLVLAGWLLFRARLDDLKITRNLNAFSAMLAGIGIVSILMTAVQGVGRREQAVEPVEVTLQPPAVKRDIYYLVFDRYADEQTLSGDFDHDNRPFLDGLRRRGFQVAGRSRANYPKTELSMASALNMSYHGDSLASIFHYREMIDKHLVGAKLVEQGYRYYHLGNPLDGLRHNAHATVFYRFSRMPTEFSETVFKMTPFYAYMPSTDIRKQVTQKFELIEQITKSREPKFVYAHFLVPHNPWKFDRDGSMLGVSEAASRTERENYVNQLVYTNSRIEETVDIILKNSEVPPIIIVQADEGPELRYENDREKSDVEKMRKRAGIITAVHFPDQDDSPIPQDLSPVNTFRLVFNRYFDAGMPLLDERVFYWDPATPLGKPDWSRPGALIDVTEALDRADEGERASAAETETAATPSPNGPSVLTLLD